MFEEREMRWSVAEAKARLSEVLRRARAGEPQTVGSQNPCVIISQEDYEKNIQKPREHLGLWLIEAASRVKADIELPPRAADRAIETPDD
jgi:prevent-host-death family protein